MGVVVERDLDSAESPDVVDNGEVEYMTMISEGERPEGINPDGTGLVYAATPGYWGSHDQGLAYSVIRHDHVLHCGAYPMDVANPSLPCLACELIDEREE